MKHNGMITRGLWDNATQVCFLDRIWHVVEGLGISHLEPGCCSGRRWKGMSARPRSKTQLNSKGKPSAKGKVGSDIAVGDRFEAGSRQVFVVVAIDPESNLPYLVRWENLGYPCSAYLTYTSIKVCRKI